MKTKIKSKILGTLLVIAMLISVLPMNVFANEEVIQELTGATVTFSNGTAIIKNLPDAAEDYHWRYEFMTAEQAERYPDAWIGGEINYPNYRGWNEGETFPLEGNTITNIPNDAEYLFLYEGKEVLLEGEIPICIFRQVGSYEVVYTSAAEGAFIDSVDVQIDWDKIPLLEDGMTELPFFEEVPGTVTVAGETISYASWAVKVDESFKITSEDSYYNELLAMDDVSDFVEEYIYSGNGEGFVEWYNEELDRYITVYSGLAPTDFIFTNPYYKVNEQDTYSMYIATYLQDVEYTFGGESGEEYQGELTSNVDILCQFVDADGEGVIVFFKLGTIAEIEDAKNEAGKEPVTDVGEIEKDAEVAEDAPIDNATLDNSKDDLLNADNIFTETEKQAIADGADAKVWLEINKISDIPATDKSKIEEEAAKIMGEDLNITYFDAKLFKQIGNNPKAPVSEPGIAIKVTITIPETLLNTDETINREYMILRFHEGQSKADVIEGTFNAETGEFTFETDKFSTYAIVYKDTLANVNDSPAGCNNVVVYGCIASLISGLGIFLCTSKRKAGNKAI